MPKKLKSSSHTRSSKLEPRNDLLIPTIISRVFDPILLLALTTLTAAIVGGLSGPKLVQFAILFSVGMVVPPVALLMWEIKNKRISNWDVSVRKQRIVPLTFMAVLLLLDLVVVYRIGNPTLNHLFFLYFIWLLGFLSVTLFWKLSGHSSVTTLTVLLFFHWFGWNWWPLLLVIPLVCWARVVRKDHSLAQVIAGVFYSILLYFISTKLPW